MTHPKIEAPTRPKMKKPTSWATIFMFNHRGKKPAGEEASPPLSEDFLGESTGSFMIVKPLTSSLGLID